MGQKSGPAKEPAEQVIREFRRSSRRQFSAEEKIRIVLSGLRGEDSIAELCRREGIVQNLYYRWSKEFLTVATRDQHSHRRRRPPSSCFSRESTDVNFSIMPISVPYDANVAILA